MTPEELSRMRDKLRALALEKVASWEADIVQLLLASHQAPMRSLLRTAILERLEKARAEYLQITMPGLDAAHSDLIAGEFQEAFDAASKKIRSVLSQAT